MSWAEVAVLEDDIKNNYSIDMDNVDIPFNKYYKSKLAFNLPDFFKDDGSSVDLVNELLHMHLPYNFHYGSAVVYNNEIHILGGGSTDSDRKKHYKWNGEEWSEVSTLPYIYYGGSAVVYNNEIHILGSSGDNKTKHYKWDGEEWYEVSTLPYDFYYGSAVVYNNEIHILGGGSTDSDRKKHYKWNGEEWSEVSTLPYLYYNGSPVVYNNEIHILGSGVVDEATKHYKWDGEEWSEVSTLPYMFSSGPESAVVYNNEIHILGVGKTYEKSEYHYKWDGEEWKKEPGLMPYVFAYGSVVVYDNNIHILGGGNVNNRNKHCKWNGKEYKYIERTNFNETYHLMGYYIIDPLLDAFLLPNNVTRLLSMFIYNNKIRIFTNPTLADRSASSVNVLTMLLEYDEINGFKIINVGISSSSPGTKKNLIHYRKNEKILYLPQTSGSQSSISLLADGGRMPLDDAISAPLTFVPSYSFLKQENSGIINMFICDSASSSTIFYYRYNGSTWTQCARLTTTNSNYRVFKDSSNDTMYVLTLNNYKFYRYNSIDDSWTVAPTPSSSTNIFNFDCINNKQHFFITNGVHYIYDGTSFTNIGRIRNVYTRSADSDAEVTLNDCMYFLYDSALSIMCYMDIEAPIGEIIQRLNINTTQTITKR